MWLQEWGSTEEQGIFGQGRLRRESRSLTSNLSRGGRAGENGAGIKDRDQGDGK